MGSPFSFDRMYRGYSDLFEDDPAKDFVTLSEEQKRKKQEEEERKALPWYMKYDQEIGEAAFGTDEHPTAAGYIKKGIEAPFDIFNKGKDILTSKIAGVPEQPFRKTLEGAFAPSPDYGDLGSAVPGVAEGGVSMPWLEEGGYDPSVDKVETPKAIREVGLKGAEFATDPTLPLELGPLAPVFGPKMISGGAEQFGTGYAEATRERDPEEAARLMTSGAIDIAMGGMAVKHPIESVGSVVGEAFPEQLQRPIEYSRPIPPPPPRLPSIAEYADLKAKGRDLSAFYETPPEVSIPQGPEPIYMEDYFSVGKPSAERGAISLGSEGLGKLNAFEDSQYRKYGANWRKLQSPEEGIYHDRLIKGYELEATPPVEAAILDEPSTIEEVPPVEPPKTGVEEQLAKVMSPKMAERVLDLTGQGHTLDRALRIAKAESIEATQGPEALTTQDLEYLMAADKPPIYEKPKATTEAEPIVGGEEVMMVEPLKRGRPRKQPPPEEVLMAEPLPEGVESDITAQEVSLIDKITKAQEAEEISSLKDEARNVGDMVAYETALRKQMLKEKNLNKRLELAEEMRNLKTVVRETERLGKSQFKEKRATDAEAVREMQKRQDFERKFRAVQVREKAKAEKAAGRLVKPIPENEILASDNFRQAWAKMSPGERARAPLEVLRALRASGDVPVLRQGKQISYDMLFNDPKALAQSLKSTAKQAFSETEFKATQDALVRDPNIKLGVEKFGLDLPGIGKGLKEEAFHGGITTKIPGISKAIINPSDRAYTAFLNSARAWKYNHIVKKLGEAGFEISNPDHAQVFKDAAKAVNIMSSRGHFDAGTVAALNKFSTVLWAPRHRLAKGQALLEYGKARTGLGEQMHKVVARDFAKSVERVTAVNLALLGLAGATGAATVEWDPAHTDFAKFKIGGTSIDPWMGLQPIVRNSARAILGREVSSTGRESETSLDKQFGRYILSGAAPGPALLWNIITGKDPQGFEKDRFTATIESVTPMLLWNIGEQLYYNGILDAIITTPSSFLGEGVDVRKSTSTFGPGTKKRKKITTFGG